MKKYINLVSEDFDKVYKVRLCSSFFERLRGYMFQRQPSEPALLFPNSDSIHMFFMSFPIDVLFLDSEYCIVKRVDELLPGKIVWPVRNAKIVLEAPVGYLAGLEEGMKLELRK